ncbi:MAG: hypothetical protein ACOC44_00565 [Promethearchaeia archaeon]
MYTLKEKLKELKDIQLISLVEGALLVSFLICSIITIFELLSLELYSFKTIFGLWSLRISFILFVLFFSMPYLVIYLLRFGKKIKGKYARTEFKKDFFKEIEGKSKIDILTLSKKYHINLLFIKNYLRDLISQGLLKGELVDNIFEINEDFEIKSMKEKRMKFFKENLGKYLTAHRRITLNTLSENFKIPKKVIKQYMVNLLNKGVLKGYFDKNVYIRDISKPVLLHEKLTCPHCKKEINIGNKK